MTLHEFLPAGPRGAIIITTQNPVLKQLAQEEIQLEPLSDKEGCALIQRYLNRGGSEQRAAEALSHELGGLPLAISTLVGYVANSQCPIEQIIESYRQRSNRIWVKSATASISSYEHKLATVWDLSWQRLSPDAKELLELMAFLNADAMPERLFVGPGFKANIGGHVGSACVQGGEHVESHVWEFWDSQR